MATVVVNYENGHYQQIDMGDDDGGKAAELADLISKGEVPELEEYDGDIESVVVED